MGIRKFQFNLNLLGVQTGGSVVLRDNSFDGLEKGNGDGRASEVRKRDVDVAKKAERNSDVPARPEPKNILLRQLGDGVIRDIREIFSSYLATVDKKIAGV